MKKLIALCAVALSLGAFADDSYLYWMVGEELSWTVEDGQTAPTEYNTVRIGVITASDQWQRGYLTMYTSDGQSASSADISSGWASSGYAALGGYASEGYSYYIELLNDNEFVGRSTDYLSYSAAKDLLTSLSDQINPASAWSVTSFTTAPVPEPTSGMLLLFGLAGLALRRKRA